MNAADPAVVAALLTLHAATLAVFRVLNVVPPPAPPRPSRTRLATAILEALEKATAPMRGKDLAKLAGHKPNAHFRETVASMKREGLIVRVNGPDGGYRLAGPPSAG